MNKPGQPFVAKVFRVSAGILWVMGMASVAIVLTRSDVTAFDFLSGIAIGVGFFILGFPSYAIGKLFEYLHAQQFYLEIIAEHSRSPG